MTGQEAPGVAGNCGGRRWRADGSSEYGRGYNEGALCVHILDSTGREDCTLGSPVVTVFHTWNPQRSILSHSHDGPRAGILLYAKFQANFPSLSLRGRKVARN